ncbi:hypothetical protein GFL96_37095 [Rhizobium leguminosarum bv. viciae]|nr:hypothetical protein [Rhizobium leguminosarum bv. viciae]
MIKLVGFGVRLKLEGLAASDCSRSSRFGGAYSCALPRHSQGRQILSRSWEGSIFVADKATRRHGFSTAHGAYDSGLRAATKCSRRCANCFRSEAETSHAIAASGCAVRSIDKKKPEWNIPSGFIASRCISPAQVSVLGRAFRSAHQGRTCLS